MIANWANEPETNITETVVLKSRIDLTDVALERIKSIDSVGYRNICRAEIAQKIAAHLLSKKLIRFYESYNPIDMTRYVEGSVNIAPHGHTHVRYAILKDVLEIDGEAFTIDEIQKALLQTYPHRFI
jgi:hypothetical protein